MSESTMKASFYDGGEVLEGEPVSSADHAATIRAALGNCRWCLAHQAQSANAAVDALLSELEAANTRADEAIEDRDRALEARDAWRSLLKAARTAEGRLDTAREAIIRARRDLWWFIEKYSKEYGEPEDDEIVTRAMAIRDQVLAPALAAVSGGGE